jgi:orotate phosphoribosyltransferase
MIINQEFSRELALKLLQINAVILRPHEPFKWTSGWNSPIYCDNRLTMRYPKLRSEIADHIANYIKTSLPEMDVITGTATAGIPHAAWVAERLDKPLAYVRGKAKTHGTTSQIEGGVKKDEHTVIIEDLISTGESAITAAKVLRFVGANVDGVVSIFNYGFDQATQKFADSDIKLAYLTDYETLISIGVRHGYVDQKDLEHLNNWRKKPEIWPNG